MTNHLPNSDDALLAYVLGEGTAQERATMASQEASDAALRARIDWLRAMLTDLKAASLGEASGFFEVSRQQRANLSGIFKQHTSLADRLSKAARQVAAMLVFDSTREDAVAAGFRGAVAERLLRFEFDGGAIDLRLSEIPGVAMGSDQSGQVLIQGEIELAQAAATDKTRVLLMSLSDDGGDMKIAASADASGGYFEMRAMAGRYSLMIEATDQEILLQPLVIEQM
jgi:hypothetical protein